MFAARAGGTRRVCIRNVVLIDGTPVRTPARRRGAFNPTIHRFFFDESSQTANVVFRGLFPLPKCCASLVLHEYRR